MSISFCAFVIVILISCRNWKTFDDRTIDFCQGITLHHLPGHTDGALLVKYLTGF